MKRRKPSKNQRSGQLGHVSRISKQALSSYSLGALPILNRIIARAKIGEFFAQFMREDDRCTIPPSRCAVLLLQNFLTARDPIYGVSDWARRHDPHQLGLSPNDVLSLNDDRVGRCLDRLFESNHRSIILSTLTHVIKEFGVSLEELHNDSTTVTFSGEYDDASERIPAFGKLTRLITWGHNKDHRPDLKQLLYTLTVTRDGAVHVNFNVDDGNLTDDQTHIETWNLVQELAGTADFLYVADCKLATEKNMAHIHSLGGRFVTVLPRSRGEDKSFRDRLAKGAVAWSPLLVRSAGSQEHPDGVSIGPGLPCTKEGYRLLWFHSSRKAHLDSQVRTRRILRTTRLLEDLQVKLHSPRTRYNDAAKVRKAVEKCLSEGEGANWIQCRIESRPQERFKQARPGRPNKDTAYRRMIKERFDLIIEVDHAAVDAAAKQDGVFPLVTNDTRLSPQELYEAYKRQASIEKRFAQLKTDYQLAPVFLKSPHRIEAILTVFFFALLVQALLERELRSAMEAEAIESLELYPEERDCARPTARKTIDLFRDVQRHELSGDGLAAPVPFAPELSLIQKRVLRLLKVPATDYQGGA